MQNPLASLKRWAGFPVIAAPSRDLLGIADDPGGIGRLAKVRQLPISPDGITPWELNGHILAHADYLAVRRAGKWLIARIDTGFDGQRLKLETGEIIPFQEGMEAYFLGSYVGDLAHRVSQIDPILFEKGERARALQMLTEYIHGARRLTICDPYFLAPIRTAFQLAELVNVLPHKTLQDLEIICSNRPTYYSPASEHNLRTKVEPFVKVRVIYNDSIHDRVWIVDDVRGCQVGTSFNGIGRKHALFHELSSSDLKAFQSILKTIRK